LRNDARIDCRCVGVVNDAGAAESRIDDNAGADGADNAANAVNAEDIETVVVLEPALQR
jgi:hypothetical protein